jgi:hypothetical protein
MFQNTTPERCVIFEGNETELKEASTQMGISPGRLLQSI